MIHDSVMVHNMKGALGLLVACSIAFVWFAACMLLASFLFSLGQ